MGQLHNRIKLWIFAFRQWFYLRDAMRAHTNYGPVSVCLSVCLSASVPSRCSVEVAGRIELVFGTEASSDLYYTVF